MQLVLGTTWVWGGIRRLACRGEYGHVGSTSDRLGGLGLIADTCSQSDQSGSVDLRDYDTVARAIRDRHGLHPEELRAPFPGVDLR